MWDAQWEKTKNVPTPGKRLKTGTEQHGLENEKNFFTFFCLFHYGEKKGHIKFSILAIFKPILQWWYIHSHLGQQISKTFSSCKTETLCPLNNSSPFLPPLSVPGNSACMSLTTLDTSYKWNHLLSFFCEWIISHSTMSSRFIHVVPSF